MRLIKDNETILTEQSSFERPAPWTDAPVGTKKQSGADHVYGTDDDGRPGGIITPDCVEGALPAESGRFKDRRTATGIAKSAR